MGITGQTLPMVGSLAFVLGAALAGLVFGSFLSALTWRLPRGESVAKGRSRCPACGTTLEPVDLVPLLSWLLNRGRCRHCTAPVPSRYPLTEGATAALLAGIAWQAPSLEQAAVLMALGLILMALLVIDLEHSLLPDLLILAALPPAAVWRLLAEGVEGLGYGLLGAGIAFALAWGLRNGFYLLTKRDGLGLGDVKFLGLVGLLLPLAGWPPFLLLAGLGGVALGLLWRALGKGPAFPFGPALILALLAVMLIPALSSPFVLS